jgi:hypothetical protein
MNSRRRDGFDSIEAVTGSPGDNAIVGMRVIVGVAGNGTTAGSPSDAFFAGYDGNDSTAVAPAARIACGTPPAPPSRASMCV